MSSDRDTLAQRFRQAGGKLIEHALNGLQDGVKVAVGQALESGGAEVVVIMSPDRIVVALHPTMDAKVDPVTLCKIVNDSAGAELSTWN